MKSPRDFSAYLVCLLALLLCNHVTSAEITNFGDITKPYFFPILPWDPYHGWAKPNVEHKEENGLRSIAECGFNFAGFVLPRDLKECRKYNLSAILLPTDPAFTNVDYIFKWRHLSNAEIDRRVRDLVRSSKGNPVVSGFFITDEPGVPDFPALAKAVAAVKKYAPGKFAYINLFPDYATLGAPALSQLGTSNYTEYLERFVNEVHPQFISYDNYNVEFSHDLEDRKIASSYYQNLLTVRQVALAHHLPYLNIVSANQIRPKATIPSPANLLFQAYTTLAAGYRGVTWYTYYGRGYHYASIDNVGKKTQTWAYLKEVNRQIAVLAPVLSRLKSTGVYFSKPLPADNLPSLPGDVVESVSSPTPLMIGEFIGADEKRFVMVVNLSLGNTAHFTLDARKPTEKLSLVSTVDRSLSPLKSPFDLWLPAGQGALLVVDQ